MTTTATDLRNATTAITAAGSAARPVTEAPVGTTAGRLELLHDQAVTPGGHGLSTEHERASASEGAPPRCRRRCRQGRSKAVVREERHSQTHHRQALYRELGFRRAADCSRLASVVASTSSVTSARTAGASSGRGPLRVRSTTSCPSCTPPLRTAVATSRYFFSSAAQFSTTAIGASAASPTFGGRRIRNRWPSGDTT